MCTCFSCHVMSSACIACCCLARPLPLAPSSPPLAPSLPIVLSGPAWSPWSSMTLSLRFRQGLLVYAGLGFGCGLVVWGLGFWLHVLACCWAVAPPRASNFLALPLPSHSHRPPRILGFVRLCLRRGIWATTSESLESSPACVVALHCLCASCDLLRWLLLLLDG